MGNGQKTILITGGAGFIGRNLTLFFQDRGYRIVVLDPADLHIYEGSTDINAVCTDMSDTFLLREIIRGEDPHYILHLAGLVTASREDHDIQTMIAANTLPLDNVLRSLKPDGRLRLFINFGSAEEYGPIRTPYTEDQPGRPQSPYALAKLHNTSAITYLADQASLRAVTLRPGFVYGPWQSPDKFLPSVLRAALAGEPVVMTEGLQTRDFIYVQDLARIVESFLSHPFTSFGGVFNAATGTETLLMELVHMVMTTTESSSNIDPSLPYREKEAMNFVCDMSKTRQVIGSSFAWTSLEEGLKKTINHYREPTSGK